MEETASQCQEGIGRGGQGGLSESARDWSTPGRDRDACENGRAVADAMRLVRAAAEGGPAPALLCACAPCEDAAWPRSMRACASDRDAATYPALHSLGRIIADARGMQHGKVQRGKARPASKTWAAQGKRALRRSTTRYTTRWLMPRAPAHTSSKQAHCEHAPLRQPSQDR